jgi:membrane-associated phospholipid phosphatase
MTRPQCFLVLRIVLAIAAGGLFWLLSQHAHEDSALDRFDLRVAENLSAFQKQAPVLGVVLFAVTLLASFEPMMALVPLGSLLLWTKGLRRAAIVFLLCGIGSGLSNKYLKQFYDRTRPEERLQHRWVWEDNDSFPSGHASSSMAVYGFLGYLCFREARTRRGRFWGVAGFALLILVIGFSRAFLCAHWVSDVIGGYLLGTVWLMLAISAASAFPDERRGPLRDTRSTDPSPA